MQSANAIMKCDVKCGQAVLRNCIPQRISQDRECFKSHTLLLP